MPDSCMFLPFLWAIAQAASDSIQYNLSENQGLLCNIGYLAIQILFLFSLWYIWPDLFVLVPKSLVSIVFVLFLLCLRSRNNVLGVFSKILMFFLFALAFTATCMSYNGSSMIQGSELLGKCHVSIGWIGVLTVTLPNRWPCSHPFACRSSKLLSWR